MKSQRIAAAVVLTLSLVGLLWAVPDTGTRLPDGTEVDFLVPTGTTVTTGAEGSFVVFTGPSEGTATTGNCFNGSGHIQSAVAINPGSPASHVTVIVLRVDELHQGTRLGSVLSQGTCGPSSEFDKYRAVVQ